MDPETLRRAFQRLVDRHAALRTTFPAIDGEPWQVVHDHVDVAFHVEDATSWSDTQLDSRISEETYTPFDLERDPPFRVTLLRQPHGESILLLALHHIVTDMWSLAILLSEVPKFYQAELTGVRADLKPLRIEYTDHVRAQLEMLEEPEAERHWEFWQSQLSGDLPVLELPTDRPRHATPTDQGTTETFIVSADVTEHILDLARAHHTTLEAVILAAFQVLLHRYTGQEDILVGSTRAGRTAKSARTFGYFANPIVMRGDLSGNPTFGDFLSALGATANAAGEHDDYPLAKVVERLQPQRDIRWSSLFQVMFTWRKTTKLVDPNSMAGVAIGVAGTSMAPEGIQLEVLPVRHRCTAFDLTLLVAEAEGALLGTFEYKADLFKAATVQRMVGHFQTLLQGIVADPEQPISRLPILTGAERRQLLVEWNDTQTDYPKEKCLHELVEIQAHKTPNTVAVVFEEQQLTYGELNSRPDSLVGICIPRSLEMIVGLLGILKAGRAYVPLDPSFPAERLRYIIADSEMPVLLTVSTLPLAHHLVSHMAGPKPRLIELDRHFPNRQPSTHSSALAAPDRVGPENLAYVMYTSGSTGKPKGVEVPHRAVVNFLTSMAHQPGLTADDVWLAVTTLSFDISVLELFLPLVSGAKTVLADKEERLDGHQLAERLTRCGATVMQATPVMWRMLVESGWPGDGRLKMLCGGETLPLDLAAALLKREGELWNMYGPTETTVWSTIARIDRADGPITIGRPIANTQTYIVDGEGELAPVGIAGELWIGGDGVAGGYRNREELTDAKFVADRFRQQPGARVYRTGDRARYLPDGQIEYLGRLDHQVKVRGFRVELGEIESCLNQHPAVKQAVVTTSRDLLGQNSLAAYVAPATDAALPLAEAELRRYLRGLLPDYMIPATYVFLDAFPLTPNGKVNRKELPPPSHENPRAPATVLPPRSSIEATLQQMWQDMLQVHPIGIQDDFFELGGHSLLAVRLFAQVETAFGVRLPLTVLYQEATIEHLAEVIDRHAAMESFSSLVELQPQGTNPPFFCVHGITGDLLWFGDLARHLAPNQPFYGLESPALHSTQQPPSDIRSLATQYLALIRTKQPKGPYYLGGASFGGIVAFEMAQQLAIQGERVPLLAVFDLEPPNVRTPNGQPAVVESLHYAWQFLRNLPLWAQNLQGLSFQQILDRVWRYCRLGNDMIKRQLKHSTSSSETTGVSKIIDYADQLPEHRRRLIEMNFDALKAYVPEMYHGRITLFKSRARPLFGVFDPETSWLKLATGGVEVITMPGSHEGMFKGAQTQVLASRLKEAIEQAWSH